MELEPRPERGKSQISGTNFAISCYDSIARQASEVDSCEALGN